MNNKESLVLILSVLKQKRRDLVEDFVSENVNVYQPMIRYRNSKSLTEISIERYFLMWVNDHYNVMLKQDGSNEEVLNNFSTVFLSLIEEFKGNKNTSDLMENLLDTKISALNEMLKTGNKSEKVLNQLRYSIDKDDMLFEKLIAKINNDDI